MRDGSELAATETLQHELFRADHLGILGGIWDDVIRRVQATRFEHALRGALPADLASQALDDPACTWLWRSLREAEAAGARRRPHPPVGHWRKAEARLWEP